MEDSGQGEATRAARNVEEGKGGAPLRTLTIRGVDGSKATVKVTDLLSRVRSGRSNEIGLILSEIDRDGDGEVDIHEMLNLLEGVVEQRRERKRLYILIGLLTFFSIAMVGTIVGLTYAVVQALKDTEVNGDGVMYVKGSTTQVVQVSNRDLAVADGLLVDRSAMNALIANAAHNATHNGTTGAGSASVNVTAPGFVAPAMLRTASYLGSPQPFSSRVDIRTLMELKHLYIKGSGEVELAVQVLGVARVVSPGSVAGTVVRILSIAGTITLDDTTILFDSNLADIFEQAGFRVSRSRRMLIGAYDILGFFNYIANTDVFNLPASQPKPALPSSNFMMKLRIFEPCVLAASPEVDRCYFSVIGTDGQSTRRRVLTSSLGGAAALPPPSALLLPTAASIGHDASPDEKRRPIGGRGMLHTLTTSRRSLQEFLPSNENALFETLAGTVEIGGVRYMAHNETFTKWGDLARTVVQFAHFPAYRKVELLNLAAKNRSAWQEEIVPPNSSLTDAETKFFCGNYPLVSDVFADPSLAVDKANMVNFTYMGNEDLDGRAARHFRLTVNHTTPNWALNGTMTKLLTVDYFDSPVDQTPLGFEFHDSTVGRVMIHVLEFKALTQSPGGFDVPDPAVCSNSIKVPYLTSAFTVPKFVSSAAASELESNATTGPPGLTPSEAPRTIGNLTEELTQAFLGLLSNLTNADEVASWPGWAQYTLSSFNITLNDTSSSTAVVRSGAGGGHHRQLLQSCSSWGYQYNFPIGDAFPCKGGIGTAAGKLVVQAGCEGEPFGGFPFLSLSGTAKVNLCEMKAEGCIGLSLSVKKMVEKGLKGRVPSSVTGIFDAFAWDILEICVGYDGESGVGYVSGGTSFKPVIAKIDLTGTVKFSSCCVWVDEVNFEVYLGLNAVFFEVWVSVVDVDLLNDVFFRGSKWEMTVTTNPTPNNINSRPYAYWGHFGDWRDWKYCTEELSTNGFIGKEGRAIVGFSQQIQEDVNWRDNTGINGMRVQCGNGQNIEWKGAFGAFSSMYRCPRNGYIVAMRLKYHNCGPGCDDRSVTAMQAQCNDGTILGNYEGAILGQWLDWARCPDFQWSFGVPFWFRMCGFQLLYENPGGGDNTGVNGLRLACCWSRNPWVL